MALSPADTDRPTITGSRVAVAAAGAAICAQIWYPLTAGSARDIATVAVVLLLAAACLCHAASSYGVRWAAIFFLVTAGLGLLAEIVGSTTGYPFGCYDYASGRLGPAAFGVPLVVPLAWTGGLYPIWSVATALRLRGASAVLLTAVTMVGWDLYLDPQMVDDGQWQWCSGVPGLPGLSDIPLTNYLGWFAVALVMTTIVTAVPVRDGLGNGCRGRGVPIVLFVWTWLGSAFAHAVFLDGPLLRWSPLYGLAGMSVLGVPLLLVFARRAARRRADGPPA